MFSISCCNFLAVCFFFNLRFAPLSDWSETSLLKRPVMSWAGRQTLLFWTVTCSSMFMCLCVCTGQAYKHDSTNISVIEWLGAYYIESQFCEKAVPYFERATVIQSVLWPRVLVLVLVIVRQYAAVKLMLKPTTGQHIEPDVQWLTNWNVLTVSRLQSDFAWLYRLAKLSMYADETEIGSDQIVLYSDCKAGSVISHMCQWTKCETLKWKWTKLDWLQYMMLHCVRHVHDSGIPCGSGNPTGIP